MDRDNRWERVERAWKLIFLGDGTYTDDVVGAVKGEYAAKKNGRIHARVRLREGAASVDRRGDGILFSTSAATVRGNSARWCCATTSRDLPAPIIRRSAT